MDAAAPYQEDLEVSSSGTFTGTTSLAALGLEPDLVAMLVADGPLCFLDFEATGLDPSSEALIEAGAVLIAPDRDDAAIFNTFIHSELVLSPFIKRLTGIEQRDVDRAPPAREVARALDAFIGDAPVVAHNARFEQTWLIQSVNERFAQHGFLDTVELLALVYPDSRNMKLDTFCRSKLMRKERHRALDDALDTLRIAVNIFAEARDGRPGAANALLALRAFKPQSPWLGRLQRAPGSPVLVQRPSAAATPAVGEAPRAVPFDCEAIAARLAAADVAGHVIRGYETREGQMQLLQQIYDCFSGKGGKSIRICEAGTGIGKTLAYLAVAIPFARETGEQVIISTSSKLLQRQLIEKDIPAAAWLLGYPDLRFTSMKGRANYLCRARLDRFLDRTAQLLPQPDDFAVAMLSAFARNTEHGEVDRLPGVLYQMYPDLERCRREVTSADATECSRQTCQTTRGDCVFRDARARMEGADLIVVNHDLLLRWLPDYPRLCHLIVDEVHELAERADGAYARSADAIEIVHRIETVLGRKAEPAVDAGSGFRELGTRALELVHEIGVEARRVVGSVADDTQYRDELAVPLTGPGPAWSWLVDLSLELAAALDTLGRRLAGAAETDESPAAGAAESLLDAAVILRDSFPQPPAELVVRFRGLARQASGSWRLVATPVSPAADFQLEILDRVETLFGTSATVAVADDTRGALGTLEFPERAAGRFQLGDPIESPFNYERNLRIVFIDEPTDPARLVGKTVTAVATVARHLGGRTMGLFTSRDRLATVTDALDAELGPEGISIIAPSMGNADPHDLVRTFMETENAVLLGARAFWQGVDVPGDACQALVIEKLPFDVPSDPLVQRRMQLIDGEGGHSFPDYMLPRMLLRLKQMAGRLIRTPTDRGMVIVVEPRADKRYFDRVREAFPPRATQALVRLCDLDAQVSGFLSLRR
jgi:ATP-dependent DNA helicase DinG